MRRNRNLNQNNMKSFLFRVVMKRLVVNAGGEEGAAGLGASLLKE